MSRVRIKEVTLEYVVNNLKGNKPDEEVKQMISMRRSIQADKMKDTSGESFEKMKMTLTMSLFKSKPTKTYDFLLKSEEKYKKAIYELCKTMIEEEESPTCFTQMFQYCSFAW